MVILATTAILVFTLRFSVATQHLPDSTRETLSARFRQYQLVTVQVQGPIHNNINVTFHAFDKTFHLRFHRPLRRPIDVIVVAEDGERSMSVEPGYYTGIDGDDVNTFAHGTVDHGVFSGSLYKNRLTRSESDVLYIEPLCIFVPTVVCTGENSVVYKRRDLILSEETKRAMRYKSTPHEANLRGRREPRSGPPSPQPLRFVTPCFNINIAENIHRF